MDKDYLMCGRALGVEAFTAKKLTKVGKADWPHGVGFPDYFYKYVKEG